MSALDNPPAISLSASSSRGVSALVRLEMIAAVHFTQRRYLGIDVPTGVELSKILGNLAKRICRQSADEPPAYFDTTRV